MGDSVEQSELRRRWLAADAAVLELIDRHAPDLGQGIPPSAAVEFANLTAAATAARDEYFGVVRAAMRAARPAVMRRHDEELPTQPEG